MKRPRRIAMGWLVWTAVAMFGLAGCPPQVDDTGDEGETAAPQEGENQTPGPSIVTNVTSVTVAEGGTANFQVRLSAQPSSDETVTVARSGGDTDLSVQSGASLTFTSSDWDTYQTVTLAAAEDVDTANDTATIRCSAMGYTSANVTAMEVDNDSGGEGEVAEGEGEPSAEGEGAPGETETIMLPGDVPLEMVWIPAGTFMMGSPDSEQDRYDWEGPQHQVTLSQGFWIGKYEVTQAQWEAVTGNNPSYFQGANANNENTDNRPVEEVSWNEIKATFLPTLNAHTGKTFRLPTESEWEYACRAGTTTRFSWGDDPDYTEIDLYAWWRGNSDSQTHIAGQKLADGFGLYDMSGNAWEWCEDDWHDDYTGAPSSGQARVNSPRGSLRVIRGGTWNGYGRDCRSAYRSYGMSVGTHYIGLRLARSD